MDDSEDSIGILHRIMGRDPWKIPCFRNTFLYSISSYVGTTLLTFLFTSRPAFSSHVGMGSFVVVTLSYYTYCRRQWARGDIGDSQLLQEYMHKALVMEGVEENDNE